MRYNAITDHDDIFAVPQMMIDDTPLWIGLTDLGADREHDGAHKWAYSVATGPWDADVQYQGEDMHGPVMGAEDPGAMVVALMGFIGAYGDGELLWDEGVELRHDGDIVATGETAEFIVGIGERCSIAANDLEEGYLEWSEDLHIETNGIPAHIAIETGKVPE
jgi:hypothetical protein